MSTTPLESAPLRSVTSGLVLLPFVTLLAFVLILAVDAPYADGWALLEMLEALRAGSWDPGSLLGQFNEHRLFFPRLAMLAVAVPTSWNPVYQCLLSIPCVIAAAFGIRRILREAWGSADAPTRWPLVVSVFLLCSLHQWRNWLWGWQVQMFLSIAAVVWVLALLGARAVTSLRVAVAGVLGIVSSLSFASGLVAWPFGLVLLLFSASARRGHVVSWCALSVLVVAGYFWGLDLGNGNDAGKPLASVLHASLSFAGSPILGVAGPGIAVVGGLAVLGLFAVSCRSLAKAGRRLLPLVLLGGFAIANGVGLAVGRFRFGGVGELGVRHVTCAVPLWLALVGSLHLIAHERDERRATRLWQRAWGAGAVVLMALLIASQVGSVRDALAFTEKRRQGREALVHGDRPTEGLGLEPYTNHMALGIHRHRILALGLSVFRDPEAARRARLSLEPLVTLQARREDSRLVARIDRGQPGRPALLYARLPPGAPFLLRSGAFDTNGAFETMIPTAGLDISRVELLAGTLNRAGALVLSRPITLGF